ncbi:hypothetical protein L6452_04919 [Arctium lappa]|uniref:Uncharacterized protein n=1 Tax=Arctium lappa TaxID=4217 RepID=A0ACB9EEZ8_ARCLA|nr:hypothetical protein L6452_04919 [Arctium lappa]
MREEGSHSENQKLKRNSTAPPPCPSSPLKASASPSAIAQPPLTAVRRLWLVLSGSPTHSHSLSHSQSLIQAQSCN